MKLRRQTIQVWAPSVSIRVNRTPFDVSQSSNCRFGLMS